MQFWSTSFVDQKCFSTSSANAGHVLGPVLLNRAFRWLHAKSPAMPPTMQDKTARIALSAGSVAEVLAIQLHTHVHYSSNFFLWVPSKFPGSEKIFDNLGCAGATPAGPAGTAASMASNYALIWSTSALRFNASRQALCKSICCCSMKSQSSPARLPHSPSVNPAVVRAAASPVGRAVMMKKGYMKTKGSGRDNGVFA